MAASIDSAGAALACVGLVGFALVLWRMLPGRNPWLIIPIATAVWTVIAIALWKLRKNRIFGRHPQRAASHHSPAPSAR
jgi:hypothetical protein